MTLLFLSKDAHLKRVYVFCSGGSFSPPVSAYILSIDFPLEVHENILKMWGDVSLHARGELTLL
jgi:hypothetical protein